MMADALMKYETIDVGQIDSIMEGKIPDPPKDWTDEGKGGGGPQNGSAVKVDSDVTSDEATTPPPTVPDPDPDPAS